ncbi:molybdopterin synthase sulfur carrier subunit [Klebsiella pneumoniae]|uniref:Molybdopterin synthase sulfur carrier subunit n=1 Tax=Klebsiella pneumoniae TaxID=573 RepID=A0A939NRI0_KLEPN|nr:molybdopterin synthase sulfur carrier subunit [Klebsiella pneumoniae]
MIKVLFLRVAATVGTDSLTLDASELATVERFVAQLAAPRRSLGAGPEEGKLLAAVSQTQPLSEHPVAATVAFFPPVTGAG